MCKQPITCSMTGPPTRVRTGPIPLELGRLVYLNILDLSWNEMEGEHVKAFN